MSEEYLRNEGVKYNINVIVELTFFQTNNRFLIIDRRMLISFISYWSLVEVTHVEPYFRF